jgi:hypothetical protein
LAYLLINNVFLRIVWFSFFASITLTIGALIASLSGLAVSKKSTNPFKPILGSAVKLLPENNEA